MTGQSSGNSRDAAPNGIEPAARVATISCVARPAAAARSRTVRNNRDFPTQALPRSNSPRDSAPPSIEVRTASSYSRPTSGQFSNVSMVRTTRPGHRRFRSVWANPVCAIPLVRLYASWARPGGQQQRMTSAGERPQRRRDAVRMRWQIRLLADQWPHWQRGRNRGVLGRCRSGTSGALREELVHPQRTTKARRLPTPCPSQDIAHRGACGKTRVVPQNLRPKPEPAEIRDS